MKASTSIKITLLICLLGVGSTIIAFNYLGHMYPSSSLPHKYYINLNGTPDCEGEFDAIVSAYQTWENVKKSYMDFTYGGTTSNSSYGEPWDGVNLLVWVESNWPWPTTWTGYNYPRVSANVNLENDIIFNGKNFLWSTSGAPDRIDVQNTATHEVGHSLSLGDVSDPECTMYQSTSFGDTTKRTLAPDDINGIIYIYKTQPPPWLTATAKKGGMAKLSTTLAEVWRVELDWEHPGQYGVSHYKVYRAESGTPFTHIGTSYGADNTFYVDNDVQEGHTYYYKLKTVNFKYGESDFGPTANVYVGEGGAKIAADDFALIAPYPNPFNTTTVIGYQIPKLSNVSLKIYNQMGQLVRTLKDGHNDPGYHRVVWDGKDNFGKDVASGLYLYSLKPITTQRSES